MGAIIQAAGGGQGPRLARKDPDKFQDFDVTLPEINIDDFDVNLDDWGGPPRGVDVEEESPTRPRQAPEEEPEAGYRVGGGSGYLSRERIGKALALYCQREDVDLLEAGTYFRARLAEVFGIESEKLYRLDGETLVDVLGRLGYLTNLYALIQAELAYQE